MNKINTIPMQLTVCRDCGLIMEIDPSENSEVVMFDKCYACKDD